MVLEAEFEAIWGIYDAFTTMTVAPVEEPIVRMSAKETKEKPEVEMNKEIMADSSEIEFLKGLDKPVTL